ncbi:MAG: hypothetical protein PHV11_04445 [Candidatus Bipolaricaulis sp.]|nr:hypothetical protein [Candidatus Bipolaricaulis sp.]
MEKGFFLIVDVLGFSSIVSNTRPNHLDQRVADWIDLANALGIKHGINRLQFISDTLFAATPGQQADLLRLVAYARDLLQQGLAASLPVRGAISHGSFVWGNLTYGPAVLQAHQLENKQDWVGVATTHVPHLDRAWGLDTLVCYPVPCHRGRVELYPAVAWDVPCFADTAKHLCEGGLTRPGEELPWEWARKVTNTVLFGCYLRFLSMTGGSAASFTGLSPVQFLEQLLNHASGSAP